MHPNVALIKEISTRFPHHAKDREALVINGAVSLEVMPVFGTKDWLHLIHIEALTQNPGEGSKALDTLLNLADNYRVNLVGKIMPSGNKKLDKRSLQAWYARRNCRPINPHNPDGLWVRPANGAKNVKLPVLDPEINYRLLNGLSEDDFADKKRTRRVAAATVLLGLAALGLHKLRHK